jgi:formiminotetrahydrofolate cyclodeaminase
MSYRVIEGLSTQLACRAGKLVGMRIDLEELRHKYSSFSDEALLAIDRAELVEAAQPCYDAELELRGLSPLPGAAEEEPSQEEQQPEWLGDAAEALSRANLPGVVAAPEMETAKKALDAAGIPCYLQMREIPEDDTPLPPPYTEWRLLVPGELHFRAVSVLDRDIFNEEFEADWRAHLGRLSDDEVAALNPETAFCGLYDRVERVSRVYNEEMSRRGLRRDDISIWNGPMEALYQDLAAAKNAPAAVTAAAVSSRLGVALLIKVLEIVGKRKSFSGDTEKLNAIIDAARRESSKLAQAADDDITADAERRRREVPMQAADAAQAGLKLCREARAVVTGAIVADLEAAVMLLQAGREAIERCVRANSQTRP